MIFGVGVGIGIQVEADDVKSVLFVECNGAFVAGLSLQNDHPRAGGFRRFQNGVHQRGSDALAALGIVEHADVADAEAVVPTFRGTLDEACQLPVLKCAEGDRVFQPLAEENIVKALFCGCFKGRILYLKALPGSANVVIAVCLILGGEFFARVDFLVQLPDLHSISSANGTSRTETVREVIQYKK